MTNETPLMTISYQRKHSVADYEMATASVTIQEPITSDDGDVLVKQANELFALAKGTALGQLGIGFNIGDNGDIIEVMPEPKQKPADRKNAAKASADSKNPKQALWEDLQNNPNKWWDNRENKTNPAGPDFKHKDSGEGLWLTYKGQNQVPDGIVLPS